MSKVIWAVPEEKRKKFDQVYSKIIEEAPKEYWEGTNYMPIWYSELRFPLFRRKFIQNLPNEYRQKINDLYDSIIMK
jgi:hypothetical protein